MKSHWNLIPLTPDYVSNSLSASYNISLLEPFNIQSAKTIRIGRTSGDLQIPTVRSVSRIHASISLNDGSIWITDRSTFGTYISREISIPPENIMNPDPNTRHESNFYIYPQNEYPNLNHHRLLAKKAIKLYHNDIITFGFSPGSPWRLYHSDIHSLFSKSVSPLHIKAPSSHLISSDIISNSESVLNPRGERRANDSKTKESGISNRLSNKQAFKTSKISGDQFPSIGNLPIPRRKKFQKMLGPLPPPSRQIPNQPFNQVTELADNNPSLSGELNYLDRNSEPLLQISTELDPNFPSRTSSNKMQIEVLDSPVSIKPYSTPPSSYHLADTESATIDFPDSDGWFLVSKPKLARAGFCPIPGIQNPIILKTVAFELGPALTKGQSNIGFLKSSSSASDLVFTSVNNSTVATWAEK